MTHYVAKGMKTGQSITLEDGTEICVDRKTKRPDAAPVKLTVTIKRDAPIGKIEVSTSSDKDGNK